jgi:thioredoxin reductase
VTGKSRFIIRRTDRIIRSDDLVIEKAELSIGRHRTRDLMLNHGAVSRDHASIKEVAGVFWLFNLSRSNGTLLNGETVDRSPLADGDQIQIGPFLLKVSYARDGFSIDVEMGTSMSPLNTGSIVSTEETIQVAIPRLAGQQEVSLGMATRMAGTGFIKAFLPGTSELPLYLYFAKRKRREMEDSEEGTMAPKSTRKVGKVQFLWRPTLDLRKPWRSSIFYLGLALTLALCVAAWILYERAFSPGPISVPHKLSLFSDRNIATRPNANSCSNCHGVTSTTQSRCESCHTTQTTGIAAGFNPDIYPAHHREGISCLDCHTEHAGPDKRAGLVSYGICYQCHNGEYKIKTDGKVGPAGTVLAIPHGGKVGYPLDENHRWVWKPLTGEQLAKRRLPVALASAGSFDQFHAIHQEGKIAVRTAGEGRGLVCSDCHIRGNLLSPGRGDELFRQSPRDQCGKCHGLAYADQIIQSVQVNCNTCHQQHNRSEDLASFIRDTARDGVKLKRYADSLVSNDALTVAEPIAATDIFKGTTGPGGLRPDKELVSSLGGLPWYAWVAVAVLLPLVGLGVMFASAAGLKNSLAKATEQVRPLAGYDTADNIRRMATGLFNLEDLKMNEPPYPHPVIDPLLCIGCHACVLACPHDVLAIVKGVASPVNMDQCMEDISCQVECPTSPKACIVINTTKKIPLRQVPDRNEHFMTNVPGLYLIGDVSGVPLIKNAINEGGQVINHVMAEISREPAEDWAEYDVAIIGMGPAGLSAAVIARQRGLRYIAIEQNKVLATIQSFPKGKEIFFKPESVKVAGGLPVPPFTAEKKNTIEIRENVLSEWARIMLDSGLVVHENERCLSITREKGVFTVGTQKGESERLAYRALQVVLAIGNRGAPRKVGVEGEDLKVGVPPESADKCDNCGANLRKDARFCPNCSARVAIKRCHSCGMPSRRGAAFCPGCGASLEREVEDKVKYKLLDPDYYVGKKCIVVGAGNSAVEAAVALCGFGREGGRFTFTRDNEVILIIRKDDFKSDVKLENKINIYDCIDAGRVKVQFNSRIREIRQDEVLLFDTEKNETLHVPNDYVFALIGAEKPTGFLKELGINISMK